MRGLRGVWVLCCLGVASPAWGFQPWLEASMAEVEAVYERWSVQADVVLRLREEALLLAEAEQLGILEAVKASGLSRPRQRGLALAILREARRHGVDPLLVVAIIRRESSFNVHAVSPVGALGLMQVMPATGRHVADRTGLRLEHATHLFDTELNVRLGTAYLAEQLQHFGSLEEALVAYNAGPGSARRKLARPEERRRALAGYPAKVLSEYRQLKAACRDIPRPEAASARRQEG